MVDCNAPYAQSHGASFTLKSNFRQAEKSYRLLLALNRERSELNQKHFAEMFFAEVDEPAAEDKMCNQSDHCLTAEESDLYE